MPHRKAIAMHPETKHSSVEDEPRNNTTHP
jgi:hypothetical protein